MPDRTTLNDQRAAEKLRSQGPLDERTSEVLTRIYLARRLHYQMNYYLSKEREFVANHDNAFRIGAIIMTLTSLFAAIGTQEGAPHSLRLLTAILPAFAAMVTGFRQLYQWDKQAQLFKDTALGLKRAELVLPDLDQTDTTTTTKIFPQLVKTAESVFEEEVNQWGQLATGKEESAEEEGEKAIEQFAKDYGINIYNEDGSINVEKLASIQQILQVSRSRTQPMSTDLSVGYPTVSSGTDETEAPAPVEADDAQEVEDESPPFEALAEEIDVVLNVAEAVGTVDEAVDDEAPADTVEAVDDEAPADTVEAVDDEAPVDTVEAVDDEAPADTVEAVDESPQDTDDDIPTKP